MSFVIDISHEIDASPEVVWDVITDLKRYHEWNPFVVDCKSSLQPGDPIDMQVQLMGRPQRQVEFILENVEGKYLAYRMKPLPLGALSSRRSHTVEALPGGRCRYESHFELNGWMMPLVRGLLKSRLEKGFTGMSQGIVERSAQLARQAA